MNSSSLIREARSWLIVAIATIPASYVLSLGVEALPVGLQRPAWVIASLLFWVVIWLIDRVPLFSVASWLLPALAAIALAHVSGVGWLFHGTLVAAVLVIGIISMYDRAWRLWAYHSGRMLQWIAERTLEAPDRRVCHQLVHEMRRPIGKLQDDLDAAARAIREPAERMLAIDPPDEEWAEVIRAAAQPRLVYAEMLEGRRPADEELIGNLGRRRDEAFYELLRARSRIYRWLTFRLFAADSTAET